MLVRFNSQTKFLKLSLRSHLMKMQKQMLITSKHLLWWVLLFCHDQSCVSDSL